MISRGQPAARRAGRCGRFAARQRLLAIAFAVAFALLMAILLHSSRHTLHEPPRTSLPRGVGAVGVDGARASGLPFAELSALDVAALIGAGPSLAADWRWMVDDASRSAARARWHSQLRTNATDHGVGGGGIGFRIADPVSLAVAAHGLLPANSPQWRKQLRSVRRHLLVSMPHIACLHVVVVPAAGLGDAEVRESVAEIVRLLSPAFLTSIEVRALSSLTDEIGGPASAAVPREVVRAVCGELAVEVAGGNATAHPFTLGCVRHVLESATTGVRGYDALGSDFRTLQQHPLVDASLRAAAVQRCLRSTEDRGRATFFASIDINTFFYDDIALTAPAPPQQPAHVFAAAHGDVANDTARLPLVAVLSVGGAMRFGLAVEEGPLPVLRHYMPVGAAATAPRTDAADESGSDGDNGALFQGTLQRVLRHPRYAAHGEYPLISAALPQLIVPLHGATSVLDGNTWETHCAFANRAGAKQLGDLATFVAQYISTYIPHLAATRKNGQRARLRPATEHGALTAEAALARILTVSAPRLLAFFIERRAAAAVAKGRCRLSGSLRESPARTLLKEVSGFYNTKAFSEGLLERALLAATWAEGRPVQVLADPPGCIVVAMLDFHTLRVDHNADITALTQTSLPVGAQTPYGRLTRSPMQAQTLACHRYRLVRSAADDLHAAASMHAEVVGTLSFERAPLRECAAAIDVDGAGGVLLLRRASNVRFRCRTFVTDFGASVALLPNAPSARRGTCLDELATVPPTLALFASVARDPQPTLPVGRNRAAVRNPLLGTARCALCEHRDLTSAAVARLENDMLDLAASDREHL